jgi:hypothetical protein
LIRCKAKKLPSTDLLAHLAPKGSKFFFFNFIIGWLAVECYSIEEIAMVVSSPPENMILFFTYYVSLFEPVIAGDESLPCNNTVALMMITKKNTDFFFEGIENLVSLGKFVFFFFFLLPESGTHLFKFFCCPTQVLIFLDESFISPRKPVKKELLKKYHQFLYYPTISSAFWESILFHYVSGSKSKSILDTIPGFFFSKKKFTFLGQPTLVLASARVCFPYYAENAMFRKSKIIVFFSYFFKILMFYNQLQILFLIKSMQQI